MKFPQAQFTAYSQFFKAQFFKAHEKIVGTKCKNAGTAFHNAMPATICAIMVVR